MNGEQFASVDSAWAGLRIFASLFSCLADQPMRCRHPESDGHRYQLDQLAREDTDSNDPNIALKAWWPAVSAARQLTSSTDFPTVKAYQPNAGGNGDAFVTKIALK